MPTLEHQRISRDIFRVLNRWCEQSKLGEALYSPHPIRLWPGKYREPDVMAWLNEHRDRLGMQESGAADLAIEIVSPSNELHDTDTKVIEYAQAGIPEYWIVYPQLRQIAIHRLEDRVYRPSGLFRAGETAHSHVLKGFEISVSELFPVTAA
jgi:Uma2 family endonuclease